MNVLQNLTLKAADYLGLFKGLDNNPFYSTHLSNNGWKFSSFNETEAIENGYAKNADLYSIIKKISSSASTIPLKLYDINADGEKELVTEGELFDLLQQPNRMQSIEEFVNESMTYLLLSGNNYVSGHKSMGFGDVFRELNVLPSNYVTIETGGIDNPIKSYNYLDTYNITFDYKDVMQVRYSNPSANGADRLYGLSPLSPANFALQSSNNIYEAKGSIVKNNGINALVSSGNERGMRPEEAQEMQDVWETKNSNPSKFGRNIFTTANVNVANLGLSPDKLQLLEGSIQDLRAMCRVYAVDPKLFGDVAASTYNNMLESKKAMYVDSVLPNLNLWLKSFNNWFIADWSKHDNKNYCLEADTSSIEALQQDQKVEADKDKVIADTITSVLNTNVSVESKVQTLIYSIGMSEEEARLIVGEPIEEPNEND